jgi:hypothetical protein
MKTLNKIFLCVVLFLFGACDKGYQIRVNNLYTEKLDSVVIGKNKIVFTDIARNTATEYRNIVRGQYDAKCVTSSKKRFELTFFVSGKGTGTKTIQLDAIGQAQLIEE